MRQATSPSRTQSQDLILARLDEMEERITQKLVQVLQEMKAKKAEEIFSDEVTIIKGQINKAENTIEKWFEQLMGDVIGELDFIDKTTYGYLDSIPKNCGMRIITSNIKELDKCITKAKKCARDRPYLEIMKINKVHQRWIGSKDSFFIEIGTDLKSDALGHSTHTIRKLAPKAFKKSISSFERLWRKSQKELRQIYGGDLHKSMIYSKRAPS